VKLFFQCTFDYVRNKIPRKFLIPCGQKSEKLFVRFTIYMWQAESHCIFRADRGYVYLVVLYNIYV